VFLLACIVGFNRIAPYVPLRIHAGAYCFLTAALLSMIAHASLDRRTVWRAIAPEHTPECGPGPVVSCPSCDLLLPMSYDGGRCPRCGARVHARKPDSIVRTAALVATGYLLYLPANIYSMSTMHSIAGREPHTIFWGIMRLVEADLLPLAVLIFFTSIMLPLLKLMALTWFLLSIHYRSARHLVRRTKVFRLVDDLGRWSNMDPFTVAVFAPLIQFGGLISIRAGIGSTCFFVVVTSSMFASHWFDPRLMWDAAEEGGEAGEGHPVRTARSPTPPAGAAYPAAPQLDSHQEGTP
jgi:paraquat-inducible protein A